MVDKDWWQLWRWDYSAERWELYGDERYTTETRTGYIPGDTSVPLCAAAKADHEIIRQARAHNHMVDVMSRGKWKNSDGEAEGPDSGPQSAEPTSSERKEGPSGPASGPEEFPPLPMKKKRVPTIAISQSLV